MIYFAYFHSVMEFGILLGEYKLSEDFFTP